MTPQAYAEPMRILIVDGDIVVLGPDGVGVSITPECAEESGRRLIAAAEQARRVDPGPRAPRDGP
jgi:hypothetical protein